MRQLLFPFVALAGLGLLAGAMSDAAADSHEDDMLTADTARAAIVGRWRAADDPASVVGYAADGTATDEYEGEDVLEGTWEIIAEDSFVRLRVVIDNQDFDYEVIGVSDEYLSISYIARGNTLLYERIDE